MVRFSTLDEKGIESNVRIINNSDIQRCPGFILLPNHYRDDGTCRHDEMICEEDNCNEPKFADEIFCKVHCEM